MQTGAPAFCRPERRPLHTLVQIDEEESPFGVPHPAIPATKPSSTELNRMVCNPGQDRFGDIEGSRFGRRGRRGGRDHVSKPRPAVNHVPRATQATRSEIDEVEVDVPGCCAPSTPSGPVKRGKKKGEGGIPQASDSSHEHAANATGDVWCACVYL